MPGEGFSGARIFPPGGQNGRHLRPVMLYSRLAQPSFLMVGSSGQALAGRCRQENQAGYNSRVWRKPDATVQALSFAQSRGPWPFHQKGNRKGEQKFMAAEKSEKMKAV